MRGRADEQVPLFHMFSVEERIRPDHPLRDVKRRVDRILSSMSSRFAAAYSTNGRPSVPPERLLKALLLITLYSIRSEWQLCEAINVNLLFRWFLDMQPSDEAFDPTTFTHNRQRLDDHELTKTFFDAVVAEAFTAGLCSEHFSVDGTLIESFASAKSFQPKSQKRTTRMASSRGMWTWIFMGKSGRTRPMRVGRTPRRSCIAKEKGRKRSWLTWATR
jgi:transposase